MSRYRDTVAHTFSQGVLYAALGSALALPAVAAQEQSEVTELKSISVQGENQFDGYQANKISSDKFTAPLLDTPRTVNIIPEELIKDRGATSLQDVLRSTPGVTLGSGEGGTPTGDRPFIRGYEASTDIFIDGLRDYARGSHETFNLEAVEVIKGPSSAYTGRGGTGGSINLETKKPTLHNFFEASAGYGTDNQNRFTVDGNYAFNESSAFRLNLMRMGGKVAGRKDVKIDRWGIAPSIAFGLGTPTRVILSYAHIENNDTPDMGYPFKNASNPDRVTPLEPNRKNFYGRKGIDYRKNISDTATVKAEHDINERLTVQNTTRYGTTRNEYLFTRPSFDNCTASKTNTPVASCYSEDNKLQFTRVDRARFRTTESLINQTELLGEFTTAGLKHNFITGVEFSKEDVYSRDTLEGKGGPGSSTDSFWNPNPNQNWGSRNLAFGSKYKNGDIKTRSLYAFDTVELNEQWQVNGGVRYDNFKVVNTQDNESNKDNIWSYQAGVVYKPAQNGAVYLSYGTSANPAGENLGQAGGADGPAGAASVRGGELKPEKSRSWELGTKWDVLNERLSLTAAVFETRKSNARSSDALSDEVVSNGKNRVRGFELSASGSITPKWDVWAGYTYLDPKVLDYQNNSYPRGTKEADKTEANLVKHDYSGKQIKFIAKHSATLWTTYQVAADWTVGGGVTYVGQRFVDDENTYKLPSHTVYDAMVRYDFNKNLSFQLNGNNLSNERVYDASHVGIFANAGPGRSFMLTGTYRFE